LRNNVTDIPFADASPQKRLARPPGAGIGGVGAFCVSALPVCVVIRRIGTQAAQF
jgi:hypothetical protein